MMNDLVSRTESFGRTLPAPAWYVVGQIVLINNGRVGWVGLSDQNLRSQIGIGIASRLSATIAIIFLLCLSWHPATTRCNKQDIPMNEPQVRQYRLPRSCTIYPIIHFPVVIFFKFSIPSSSRRMPNHSSWALAWRHFS